MKTSLSSRPPGATLWDFMAITKALSDENRVRALVALRGRELCLCQIVELLALATSTVSKHMSILRQARLVESRKEGRWLHYRWPGSDASPAVRQALKWAHESLADEPQVLHDAERLQGILDLDPEQLCQKQCPTEKTCGKPKVARRPAKP